MEDCVLGNFSGECAYDFRDRIDILSFRRSSNNLSRLQFALSCIESGRNVVFVSPNDSSEFVESLRRRFLSRL